MMRAMPFPIALSAFLPASLVIALALAAGPLRAATPANPATTPAARAVLDYLAGRESRPEKHLVSGQFTDFGADASLALLEKIHARTGHWPALAGFDYADFSNGSLTTLAPDRSAIAWANAGGLVTISAHLYDPTKPDGGGLRDHNVDLRDLLTPGTPAHAAWLRELDLLADGLQKLRDAGVTVLWRPFHEMNGGWFWWGGKPPADFIALWRQMFTYFTETKHLDNLLWVYAPNHGANAAEYYPGNDVVDLVGLDAYTDHVAPSHIKGYAALAALPKPFGFTEYGPHGAKNPPGDFDYRRFLAGVRRHFPRTVFFMCWNEKWGLGENEHVAAMLDDPWIVNRDDLPPGLAAPKS